MSGYELRGTCENRTTGEASCGFVQTGVVHSTYKWFSVNKQGFGQIRSTRTITSIY